MAGNEKQRASVADAQTKKGGTAHSCGGKLHKWFDRAKDASAPRGAASVLADALRNGSPEEKEAAKGAIASKLGNTKDIFSMVKDLVESGDGDPGMRGCLTSCFSSMLKSREGIGKMDTLAGTLDEAVLKEVIKCVADTNDPAALGFIIRASRKCSHPVGAWQAPKVATKENADMIRSFVQEEAAKQPPALRDKILDSAMREFGSRGVEFAAPQAESLRPAEPCIAPESIVMQPFQMRESNQRDFQPDAPPPSSGMAASVPSSQAQPSAEGDMSSHIRNMEAFFRNYGMVSGTRRKARTLDGAKVGGVVPEPEIHSLEAERRGTAAIPGNVSVSKSENGPQETPPALPRRARTNRPGKGRPQNADSKAKRAAIAEPTAQESLPKHPSQEKTAQSKPSGPHSPQQNAKTRKSNEKAKAPRCSAARAGKTALAGARKGAPRVSKPLPKARSKPHAPAKQETSPGRAAVRGRAMQRRKKPVSRAPARGYEAAPARAISSRRKPSVRGVSAHAAPHKRRPSVLQSPAQHGRREKAAPVPERRKAPVPKKLKGEGKSNAPRAVQERKKTRQKTGPERARTQLFSGSFAGKLKKANAKAAVLRPRNRSKPRGKTLLKRLAEMKRKRRQRRVALMLLMEKRKKKAKAVR